MSDGDLNRALRTSEPSNLAPQLEQPLLALAKEVLLADLTGAGRERFPGYLPGRPLIQAYSEVRIQGAVARRVDDTTTVARLLWTGTAPSGERVERHTSTIRLQYQNSSWVPVRC